MNKIPIIGLPQVGLPLLIVKAQAKHLCFLLDTGSNINVLDKRVAEFSSNFQEEQPNSNNSG